MNPHPILSAKLQPNSDRPLYDQLVDIIKKYVSAGILSAGDMLPSEAALCESLGISRSTVRQAIGSLEEEGLVVRKQGRGTFVAEPAMRRRNDNVYSFTSEVMALGHKPSSTILEFDTIRPDEKLQRMLSLQSGDIPVFRFVRIRRLDGLPLLLETSYYPRYVYPNLTREILETHSMYSLLYEVGIVPASAEDSYRAVILGEREAELLGCAPGSPGFYHERRTKSDLGEIFEFTQSLIRGDRTRLDVLMQKNGVAFSRHFEKG